MSVSLNDIGADLRNGGKYFMRVKLRSSEGKLYELPNEPLVGFSFANLIVKTPTVGKYRKGTVKEWISSEDDLINIKGFCVNEDDPTAYPTEQVKLLNDLRNETDSLEVEGNAFFELFGIRGLVIDNVRIEEMQGMPGAQAYVINATSEEDFYAELTQQL